VLNEFKASLSVVSEDVDAEQQLIQESTTDGGDTNIKQRFWPSATGVRAATILAIALVAFLSVIAVMHYAAAPPSIPASPSDEGVEAITQKWNTPQGQCGVSAPNCDCTWTCEPGNSMHCMTQGPCYQPCKDANPYGCA